MLFYFIICLSLFYYGFNKIIKIPIYVQTRNLLISTNKYQDTNSLKLYYDVLIAIYKIYYQVCLQTIFSSVKKNSEFYEISYYYGTTKYTVPIKIGKNKIYPIKIDFYTKIGNLEHNINTSILPYAGPNYNFHGISITPNYFSLTNLIVTLDDKFYKNFREKDIINIFI